MAAFAEHAEAKQQAAAVIAAAEPTVQQASLPDLPPHLVKCLAGQKSSPGKQKTAGKTKGKTDPKAVGGKNVDQGSKQGATPSADEMVLARLQAAETSQKCAQSLIAWYRGVLQASKAKVKA